MQRKMSSPGIGDNEGGNGALAASAATGSSSTKRKHEADRKSPSNSHPTETKSSPNPNDPPRKDGKTPKEERDRSSLRKGKWTVEEEEYTSRIIHYFNSGLLNLPDGATLRSYLAEKLNCDPMRITKKYAGAACLGRRAQHYRDRAQPTVAEIQLARAELDHLERRFRMRVEDGHSSVPLPPHSSDLLQSIANANRLMAPNASAAAAAGAPLGGVDSTQALFQSFLLGMAGQQAHAPAVASPAASLAPWLLPNTTAAAGLVNPLAPQAPNPLAAPPTWPPQAPAPPPAAPGADSAAMANWAFAQAAASLAPAITQLAAENLRKQQQQQQQQQLQQQIEQRIKQNSSVEAAKEYTRQLQHSFEQQLKKASQQPQAPPASTRGQAHLSASPPAVAAAVTAPTPGAAVVAAAAAPTSDPISIPSRNALASQRKKVLATSATPRAEVVPPLDSTNAASPVSKATEAAPTLASPTTASSASEKTAAPPTQQQLQAPSLEGNVALAGGNIAAEPTAPLPQPTRRRSEEDKQAGAVLLGFLSSLRNSYEEALREKEKGSSPVANNSATAAALPAGEPLVQVTGAPGTTTLFAGEYEGSSAPQVTDNSGSSQNVESSVEDSDWNSDKKADPSSSEDSDKEPHSSSSLSKGPPRKRLKTQRTNEEV